MLRQLLGDVIQFKGDLKNLEPALLKPVVEENEVCNKVGWCRVSIKYVLRPSDIDYMLDAVRQIAQHGWKISPQVRDILHVFLFSILASCTDESTYI